MIKSRILQIAQSQLARHISVVLAGNIFAAGLGFISLLFITNALSLSDFGLFSICIALLRILPIFTCFGMTTSMVTHASSCLAKGQPSQADAITRAALLFRMGSSLLVGLILIAAVPYIAGKIFRYPTLSAVLTVTALGIFFTSLFDQIRSAFYTYKRFTEYVFALVSVDLVKLSAALCLTILGKMNPVSAAAIFSIAPLVGGGLGIWNFRDKIFLRSNQARRIMRKLIPDSKWIFISDVTKNAFSYIPTFMLVKLISAKAAGIYGLALNLTYIIPILINSFSSVLLPEISRFQEISQFERHLKASLRGLACIAAMIIACLLFSGKFIIFFFGHRYTESVVIFNWLILSYLVAAVNTTLLYPMLYSLRKNRVVALTNLIKLVLMMTGCLLVIPAFGIPGPAILALILNTVSAAYLLIYVLKHINHVKVTTLDQKASWPNLLDI